MNNSTSVDLSSSVYVTGHSGLVGSAIVRCLRAKGYRRIITRSHKELDLTDQQAVRFFLRNEKIDCVVLAAAKVGGIHANSSKPAEFIYQNIMIETNVIHQSYCAGVKKLVFFGSSCIYPRYAPQPMKEEFLLSGPLEPTNEGYALAKIVGLKMVEFYRKQYGFNGISVVPCNLYGPNDSFEPLNSHVLSALVKKIIDAKQQNIETVKVWGTGGARREFMHSDDLAEMIVFLMERYDSSQILNVGWGEDISIRDLAQLVANKAGFEGKLFYDTSKPDGMPQKCMDVSRMRALGLSPNISLEEGVEMMIREYKKQQTKIMG